MTGDKFELTIDKIFSSSVRNNPKQIISYMGKEEVTYEQFRKRVYEIARGLVKLGIKKGDKVAVLEWDSLRYLEAYYAIPLAGGVLHTVNIRYPPDLIFYTMQHADDRYVIIRDEFVPLIESTSGMATSVLFRLIGSSPRATPIVRVCRTSCLCVKLTPFGRPVVPEV